VSHNIYIIRLVNGYDILFLADLLWYTSAHEALVTSIVSLLGQTGKAWIGCGNYTTMASCEAFIALAKSKGLISRRMELSADWEGTESTSISNLSSRKKTVWLWEVEWEKR
jgi:hypothetical protein